jgi:hypothetical protein
MNELMAALRLPGARLTTTEEHTGFVVAVEHLEYAQPVAKLEHMETAPAGPAVHQAGWTLHRIVVDRRHSERAEQILRPHGYAFQRVAYAGYALFTKPEASEEPTANAAESGYASPPWDVTSNDYRLLEQVASLLTTQVTMDRRDTDLGVSLELNSSDVPFPLDPLLVLRRTWDPDLRRVVAIVFVDISFSPQVVPALQAAGYEFMPSPAAGTLILVNRGRAPPNPTV